MDESKNERTAGLVKRKWTIQISERLATRYKCYIQLSELSALSHLSEKEWKFCSTPAAHSVAWLVLFSNLFFLGFLFQEFASFLGSIVVLYIKESNM